VVHFFMVKTLTSGTFSFLGNPWYNYGLGFGFLDFLFQLRKRWYWSSKMISLDPFPRAKYLIEMGGELRGLSR
jgi:hypothetical protein